MRSPFFFNQVVSVWTMKIILHRHWYSRPSKSPSTFFTACSSLFQHWSWETEVEEAGTIESISTERRRRSTRSIVSIVSSSVSRPSYRSKRAYAVVLRVLTNWSGRGRLIGEERRDSQSQTDTRATFRSLGYGIWSTMRTARSLHPFFPRSSFPSSKEGERVGDANRLGHDPIVSRYPSARGRKRKIPSENGGGPASLSSNLSGIQPNAADTLNPFLATDQMSVLESLFITTL